MKTYSRNGKKKSLYSKKDALLPSNYWELYFDTIKQNWRTILLIGIFSFLFFVPTLGFMFAFDYYKMQVVASNISEEEADALIVTARNIFYIGVALGIIFASIGISGLSRINLLVSREEGLFFFKDFNKGVKQNIKNNIVFFIIYAVLIYGSILVINNINSKNFFIYIPFALVQSIFFPMLLVNVETNAIYSWSVKDAFRNSMLIYIKNFFYVILFAIGFTSFLLLGMIKQYIFLKYVLYALLILLVYPFMILALRVLMNRSLDRDINKEHYPEIYKMGIYDKQNEDYLNNVIMKYYNYDSTYQALTNDPYLDIYFDHLCGTYVSRNDQSRITDLNPDVWGKEATINQLNYLRGLSYQKKLTFLKKSNYSVLVLKQDKKAKVAIVLAGGGYYNVCTLQEEIPVSVELYKKGFTVFSFSYPVRDKAKEGIGAVSSFVKLLFKNENRMNIDMSDYIIIGFSASGHLVGELGSDNLGLRVQGITPPKLLGLAYPVISMRESVEPGSRHNLLGDNPSQEELDKYSIELHVDDNYPATFIWQCDKDNVVPFKNSLLMVDALEKHHIPYHFESFDSFYHGLGLSIGNVAEGWVDRLYDYYLSLTNTNK